MILEVPPAELTDVEARVRAEMTGAYDLRVELAVEVATGATWADDKSRCSPLFTDEPLG